ncbi:hypothetical protein Pla52nx_005141 [Stieleria varia]|uniref:hypothetical protein n=1 Tax=Stieleria varia TaxID=2528005 RepID=UPI00313EDB82
MDRSIASDVLKWKPKWRCSVNAVVLSMSLSHMHTALPHFPLVTVLLFAIGCTDTAVDAPARTANGSAQLGTKMESDAASDPPSEDSAPVGPEQEIHGGQTLSQWIDQTRNGSTLSDRQDALQVLRNAGLNHDRERTLVAFSAALTQPDLQALAAAGLTKAGPPVSDSIKRQLYDIVASELDGNSSEPNNGLLMRVFGALGAIGDAVDVSKLQDLSLKYPDRAVVAKLSQQAVGNITQRSESNR